MVKVFFGSSYSDFLVLKIHTIVRRKTYISFMGSIKVIGQKTDFMKMVARMPNIIIYYKNSRLVRGYKLTREEAIIECL
jgi:hypothetical protein